MRKKKEDKPVCPKCGSYEIDVNKTWQLVSPFPDRDGRITVTVMGSMTCKRCQYSWRGVVSKIKIGEKGVTIGDKTLEDRGEEKRRVKEIVIDIDDLDLKDEE
ncbi:MAG: chromatin protein Cren7 [Desulfurococcaceae archaeon]|uniref:Chromatin protein Cren7 n=1 Tax=Staphylothermus marinus TaxID=2280 RepID=A0A7C4JLM9_STAMA